MKYKTMYGIHELRMWIGLGLTAVGTLATLEATHPEVFTNLKAKKDELGDKIKNKFKKDSD